MSQFNHQADVNDAQENQFDPVPAGEYLAVITESSYDSNKDNTGKILKLVYQILEGPFKDRKIFENLNIENRSQQAVAISKRALNAICVATGVLTIQDSSQLHSIPLLIDVGIRESDQYGKQNTIRKHLSAKSQNNNPVATQESSPQPINAGSDNNNATKKQPWEIEK